MVDRRGWPSEYVPHAAISIGITVQREVLRSLADKPIFRGCGLLARFLYSLPQSSLGYRKTDPAPVPPDVIETYRRNILSLLSMPFDTDEEGHKTAHVVSLDRDAQTLLRNFQERLEPQLAPYGELGSMNDWAGKLCGAVLRLAGLLHAASQDSYQGRPWEIPISAQTMRQALRMGEYLVLHARAAFSEMGADPLVERARFILGWLERRNLQTFTQRDLFLGIRSDPRFRRVELIRPVLDFLMEHGCLRMRETERSAPGRRPSPTFEVNPFLSNPTEGSSID